MQSKKIIGVFILSLMYWLYLSLSTHMAIVTDAIGYENLGRLIQTHGWISYFTTGPNREPLYPALIALSMQIANATAIDYTRIMAFFGVVLLFLTQVLTYRILRLLNVRQGICMLVLSYLAVSPALNNAAFSLFSEIAAIPVILGIILSSVYAWDAIKRNDKYRTLFYGGLLGLLLTLATFVKAVFECISPVYLIIFFMSATSVIANDRRERGNLFTFILCAIAALSFYYIPITGYKWLNKVYNGNFAITNRASPALYGNTTRRMEPLTPKRFAEALAFVPGEGVCDSLFGPQECDFWSFRESDALSLVKVNELDRRHLSAEKLNSTLVHLSAPKAIQNPLQYALLTLTEGCKMFFWESTQIGFVSYPHWLQKIYDIKILNNALRLLTAMATFMALLSLWRKGLKQRSGVEFLIGVLVFLYILFFSFFFILTRYALPIAPLYLISIGVWINNLAPKKVN